MLSSKRLNQAVAVIKSGGVIAYPTEAVYGLGCDPFNEQSVLQLLALKKRSVEQGLILIASNVRQVLPLIQPIHADDLARALKTWPGHATWIFPKSNGVPTWISGNYHSVAIRVSKHPVVKMLCDELESPLVSTSANITNENDLDSIKAIQNTFGDKIACYIDAPVGNEQQASTIVDAHTQQKLR